LDQIQVGDHILVSGPVGEHGAAVMLSREEYGFRGDLKSDAASILDETRSLIGLAGLRFMRDPTRGGLATVAHEIVRATGLTVRLVEAQIPVNDAVHSVCELLGFDPLYVACEGRLVAVVSAEASATALLALRRVAPAAAMIGKICADGPQVILETSFGGQRLLDELEDDPLPRIC
jgi:hydrogenase expression/formation protein HypE